MIIIIELHKSLLLHAWVHGIIFTKCMTMGFPFKRLLSCWNANSDYLAVNIPGMNHSLSQSRVNIYSTAACACPCLSLPFLVYTYTFVLHAYVIFLVFVSMEQLTTISYIDLVCFWSRFHRFQTSFSDHQWSCCAMHNCNIYCGNGFWLCLWCSLDVLDHA